VLGLWWTVGLPIALCLATSYQMKVETSFRRPDVSGRDGIFSMISPISNSKFVEGSRPTY